MSSRTFGAGALAALALLVSAVPVASADGITVETSAGPVTCAPDPERAPGPEAISETPFAHGLIVAIHETGALRCQIPAFGEVELTGAGLPWLLKLNEKRLTARLKGTPRVRVLLQPVGIPFLSCVYQTGKVLGTLTAGTSPSVTLSAARVRLNKGLSSGLCSPLGPLSLDVTLP